LSLVLCAEWNDLLTSLLSSFFQRNGYVSKHVSKRHCWRASRLTNGIDNERKLARRRNY
jgi:hypothetical protein